MQVGDIYKQDGYIGSFVCKHPDDPDCVVTEIVEGNSGWGRSSPVPINYVSKYTNRYWYMHKGSLASQLNNYQIY